MVLKQEWSWVVWTEKLVWISWCTCPAIRLPLHWIAIYMGCLSPYAVYIGLIDLWKLDYIKYYIIIIINSIKINFLLSSCFHFFIYLSVNWAICIPRISVDFFFRWFFCKWIFSTDFSINRFFLHNICADDPHISAGKKAGTVMWLFTSLRSSGHVLAMLELNQKVQRGRGCLDAGQSEGVGALRPHSSANPRRYPSHLPTLHPAYALHSTAACTATATMTDHRAGTSLFWGWVD